MSQVEHAPIAPDGWPARETGLWVHDKKYYVERYLDIFTRGVGRKWDGLAYVDLFSGPGQNLIRDNNESLDGSPFWALKRDFNRYVFVDVPSVLNTLRARLAAHRKLAQIKFIEGDCNAVIEQVRQAIPANYLTLVFIDPTGLQIHFRSLTQLVQSRNIDFLMTLQFGMGVRMNLPQYFRTQGEALTLFIGNTDWRKDVELGGSASQVCRRILDRYLKQLAKLGYETVRDREIPIHTGGNLWLYSIVLASRHPLAHHFWRKATDILSSGQKFLFCEPMS